MRRVLFAAAAAAVAALLMVAGEAPPSRAQSEQLVNAETAIFAGGCFWCVESDFDHVPGVLETVSGYIGGHLENPTYRDVVTETTGHREAVRITFNPTTVTYERLLYIFWRSVDPTDAGGQFCDRGKSYTTAIFTLNDAQKSAAETSRRAAMEALGSQIVTPITPAATFYRAETYHQDYYLKNPVRYKFYRLGCRRDSRVQSLWGAEAHQGIER